MINLAATHFAIDSSEQLASLLKAAGDSLRLNILRVLSQDSYGVLELCRVFDVKQSALSHHLKLLSQAQLLTTRRDGNSIFYRRAHTSNALAEAILQAADAIVLNETLQQGINQVQLERAENSKRFFKDNVDKFKAQQDLIAGFSQYGQAVSEMLTLLFPEKGQSVIEIGPGEGDFLPALSQHFETVYALDNSADMLARSKALVNQHQLKNVELHQGDSSFAREQLKNIDCAVINMVLHHNSEPQQIFADIQRCLADNGQLIVCDLCQHDQNWARENCGDIWLGFAPEQLSHWAKQTGFSEGQESYLTLRNGFRIQIRQFIKQR